MLSSIAYIAVGKTRTVYKVVFNFLYTRFNQKCANPHKLQWPQWHSGYAKEKKLEQFLVTPKI